MDRTQLADFLRRRRESLQPDAVGLTTGPRRRAAGLRREEVAALAGMSPDYYARMEQCRSPQPSEQMVAALARAMRLTLDERDHLFRLTGHHAPARVRRSEHVAPPLLRVLDRLEDTPALVVSDLADTLLQNRLAAALLGDQTRHTGPARSAYYRWFTDPQERTRYPGRDHAHQSAVQAAGLRAALSTAGSDTRARDIVKRLQGASEEFRDVWARHEVADRFDEHKTLVHPPSARSRSTARSSSPRTGPRPCSSSRPLPAPRPTTSSRCSRSSGRSSSRRDPSAPHPHSDRSAIPRRAPTGQRAERTAHACHS